MPKFYGNVGYSETTETSPGVWTPSIVVKQYAGEVSKVYEKSESTEHINDDIMLSVKVSIIADSYANLNIGRLKYIEYLGSKWKIKKVDYEPPRQVLTIGGLYNG